MTTMLPPTVNSMLDLIGNTPLVKLSHFDTGVCELFLKLENQNPGGSIKDRMALSMVKAAEENGTLKPGGTLVEATAGNTGLGLALIASQRGYKLKLVIPDKMSQEKIFHLRALGTDVVLTRSDVVKGHPDYYQDKAKAIAAAIPGAVFINQFENPANPAAHEQSTAPEIWEQMEHRLDAVVCGVGSGGTMTGIGRFFKKTAPEVEMVLADPKGSILAPFVEHGVMIEPGHWLVEGIGEDFIPANCDLSLVKRAFTVTDADSIATSREVLMREGILCGSSSGTLIAAALRYCKAQTTPKRVVTFVCDSGNKYLSKIFNEYWLDDNGMVERPVSDDLRDLISRSYRRGQVVSANPAETLQQVYARMKMFDISQVPVIEDNRVIGLIDETDILLAVTGNDKGFGIAAGKVMTDKLVSLEVGQSLKELLTVFERGRVACVFEAGHFLGLVTPIDFLNYLRKRTGKA